MMSSRRCVAAVTAVLFCTGGCSVQSKQVELTPVASNVAGTTNSTSSGQFLYAAGLKLSDYAIGSSRPLHTVDNGKEGFGEEPSLALDSHGHYVYEANNNASSTPLLAVYNASTLKQQRQLQLPSCYSLAVDHSGYLYVACVAIFVYTPGARQKVGMLHGGQGGYWVVFDHNGILYAATTHHISVYVPTKTPGKMEYDHSIKVGVRNVQALGVGPSNDLFVANWEKRSSVVVFPPGALKPSRRILKGIVAPTALAVDSKGRLYVINLHVEKPPFDGWVTVYAPGGSEPVRKLMDGTNEPHALAVDVADNLYVSYGNSLVVYSPGGTKILRTITKGIDDAEALLIGTP